MTKKTAKPPAKATSAVNPKILDVVKPPVHESRPEPRKERLVAKGITEAQKTAGAIATSASFHASAVMHPFQKNLVGAEATADALFDAVQNKVQLVQDGDLKGVEAMLLAQAMSLQTTYSSLMRRASVQEYMSQYQTYMTLALKAQAQSRATLQALIEMKMPRHAPTFIRQTNTANGPQQVNNGAAASGQLLAHAEQSAGAPTKLLAADPSPAFENATKGATEHERLDQRAPRAAG